MIIALFSDTYTPDINGVVSSIKILQNELEKKGHTVYVVCTHPGSLSNFKVIFEDNIIRLPGIELKQLYGYAIASPFHFSSIKDLEKLKLDLIHVHTEFGVGIFARFVAKNLNIPLVSTYHTTYEDYTHYVNPINLELIDRGAKKAVAKLSKMYVDSCVRVISPSEKTKNMLINYGVAEKNIKVIPTGLDIERFEYINIDHDLLKKLNREYRGNDNEKIIIYIGRIAAEKSIDIIIEAFNHNKHKELNLKLLIVGSGPEYENLIKMVDNYKLNDRIFFLGKKNREEIATYYNLADAFISASTTETQGMTYIEALASGLPIFARKDDVVKELIDENITGYYFDDAIDLAEKLEVFSRLTLKEIKENSRFCKEKAKPYDSNLFGEKVLELYREAIDDYYNFFEIKNVKIKNDNVILKLKKHFEDEIDLMISLDDYYEYGIRKTTRLSEHLYSVFKEKELELTAYAMCYKKIAARDYTIKQMYDFIIDKFDLSIEVINRIIEKLEDKKLLDDSKYANNKLDSYNRMFYSKQKIIKLLQKDGVAMEIIDSVITKYDGNNEFEFAIKNAHKYYKRSGQRSISYIKKYIYENLIKDGFTQEAINVAMEHLDFSENQKNRFEILRKHANKALKRFERKTNGSELRNKVFRYLYAQGFDIADIYAVLDEMEWNDER